MRARLVVLASGGGSNLQALLDRLIALGADAPAEVVAVISDRRAAGALDRARRAGIAAVYVPASAPEGTLERELTALAPDLIVLAGYLRLVPATVVARWRGRIVNVHPALLPDFGGPGMYGHHVHAAVLAAGARESGPTVHLVDEEYDRGEILAQARVPVLPGDTPDALAARVLAEEHRLLPAAVLAAARAGRPVPLGVPDAVIPGSRAEPTS